MFIALHLMNSKHEQEGEKEFKTLCTLNKMKRYLCMLLHANALIAVLREIQNTHQPRALTTLGIFF